MLQDPFGQFADTKLHATSTIFVENLTVSLVCRSNILEST